MATNSELDKWTHLLADEARGHFWRRAVKRLARLVTQDGSVVSYTPAEAQAIVKVLAAGLEGVHWGVQMLCRRALGRLQAPPLIEAVCNLLLAQDLPRLASLSVHHHYEPADPVRRAAYLFVVGRLQFYEEADPQGQLLAQFYIAAPIPLRDRLLGLARSRGGPQEGQLIAARLRQVGVGTLSAAEVDATLAVISQPAWYALHDPEGELLVQLYAAVAPAVRTRLWGLARLEEDQRWGRLVAVLQRERGWTEMSDAELEVTVEILCQAQRWEAVWSLILDGRLLGSWRGMRVLAETIWQPQEERAECCYRELIAAVHAVIDPTKVRALVGWQRGVLRGHQDWVETLAVSPDGQWLASGSQDGTIRLWGLPEGNERVVLRGHQDWVLTLAVSPDGQWLASGSQDGTIRLWGLPEGDEQLVLHGLQDWVRALAVSPDGQWLASGSYDGTIRLWRLPGGTEQAVLRGHQNAVRALAVSPDGQWLASGSNDTTIRLWDLPRGKERLVLRGHQGGVRALVVSTDGQWVASGSYDGTIRLWGLPEGIERAVLRGHRDGVETLVVSPDGQWLASGGMDETIRLWGLPDGAEQAVLCGHRDGVLALVASPDGKWLASGGQDGTVRLWEPWGLYRVIGIPLGDMDWTDFEHVQQFAADTLLSPEQQAVARYVAAVLRYRFEEDTP